MPKYEPREERPDADDYRAYFDSNCLRVWHLKGRPLTVRIVDVTAIEGEMFAGGKKKTMRQPKLTLESRDGRLPLPLLLNKTNAKTIARLYGNSPRAWVGQFITLYPTTTEMNGEQQDCIRIRPEKPGTGKKQGRSEPKPEPEPARESVLLPGDEQGDDFEAPEETIQ